MYIKLSVYICMVKTSEDKTILTTHVDFSTC